jgi:hypothetical protein
VVGGLILNIGDGIPHSLLGKTLCAVREIDLDKNSRTNIIGACRALFVMTVPIFRLSAKLEVSLAMLELRLHCYGCRLAGNICYLLAATACASHTTNSITEVVQKLW